MVWIVGIALIIAAAGFFIWWRLRSSRMIRITPSSSIPFEADMATKKLVQDLWHLEKPVREKTAQVLKNKGDSIEAVLRYLCTIVVYGDDLSVNEGWLIEVGRSHKDPNTKHAAEALGILGNPRTVEHLVKLLERPERVLPDGYFFSEESRVAAVEALASIGTPEAIEALIRTLDAPGFDHDDTRLACLWALCKSGNQRAVSSILWARRRICANQFTFSQQGYGSNWAGDIDSYLKSNFGVDEKRIMAEGYPKNT